MLLRRGGGGSGVGGRKVARRGLLRGGTGESSVGGGLKPTLRQVVFWGLVSGINPDFRLCGSSGGRAGIVAAGR